MIYPKWISRWLAAFAASCVVLPTSAHAQTALSLPAWAQATKPPAWHALVLGVSQYDHAWPLPAATFDAGLVRDALAKTHFGVVQPTGTGHLTRQEILDDLEDFIGQIAPGDVALLYFSGHGANIDGTDYIVPSDANPPEPGREGHVYISVDYLLERMRSKAGVAILILDNCRSDPFNPASASTVLLNLATTPVPPAGGPAGMGGATPAAAIPAATGSADWTTQIFAAYAAQPGKPAYSLFDGETADKGSIFTRNVTQAIGRPGHPIDRSIGQAERDVVSLTGQRQEPYQNQLGLGDVYLADDHGFDAEVSDAWALAVQAYMQSGQRKALSDFIGFYPTSDYAATARAELAKPQLVAALAPRVPGAPAPSSSALVVSGNLQSVGHDATGGIVASVVRPTPLRLSWNSVLPSTVLRTLQPGDLVRLVEPAIGHAAALVATADGQFGYVGHVSITASVAVHTTIDLRYATGAIDSGVISDAQLSAAQAMLKGDRTTIQIAVGPASGDAAARAAQIAFVRALRLRQLVASRGAHPERISMTYPDATLAADTARISLFQAAR